MEAATVEELKEASKANIQQLHASALALQQQLVSDTAEAVTHRRRLECKDNINQIASSYRAALKMSIENPETTYGPPLVALASPPPRIVRQMGLLSMPVHPMPCSLKSATAAASPAPHKAPTTIYPQLKPITRTAQLNAVPKKVRFDVREPPTAQVKAALEVHLKERLDREKKMAVRMNGRKSRPKQLVDDNVATPIADDRSVTNSLQETEATAEIKHRVPSHIVPYFPKQTRIAQVTNPLLLHPRYPKTHPKNLYTTEYTAHFCRPQRRALRLN
ncbi:hypothetical protein ACHHYP_13552 [Achlya hypogyna]|uniref:Uncharacterized protein n=1 Tax=Achlya hypogyna TaxID=1202772 RepID=A0A1V9YF59_ACHHY|nr:hypothetical protein ACHHYP_13552 [Achlya hypogyna]